MGWGERAEIKEDILEEFAQERAEIKKGKRQLEDDKADFALKRKQAEAKEQVNSEILDDKERFYVAKNETTEAMMKERFELQKIEFANEKADFEITKKNLANEQLQMEGKLKQAKEEFESEMRVKLMEQAVDMQNKVDQAEVRAEVAEASSAAKDAIISSKDNEIARLDELLKVTMGKLTQIDIKGLNIHVEAANAPKGNKPEGKPEGK
jgi:hypothetical protein